MGVDVRHGPHINTGTDCAQPAVLHHPPDRTGGNAKDTPSDPVDLSGYSTFTLPQSTIVIEPEAFEGISAEVVIIPEACENIGYHAFANCQKLRYVVIAPDSSIAIDAAFDGSSVEFLYQ